MKPKLHTPKSNIFLIANYSNISIGAYAELIIFCKIEDFSVIFLKNKINNFSFINKAEMKISNSFVIS